MNITSSPGLNWHGNFCCVLEFLPGEGNTVVTGRGRGTGGRTFIEVGQVLFRLLGTVVSRYTAHQDWGAHTVWLLCPSKLTEGTTSFAYPAVFHSSHGSMSAQGQVVVLLSWYWYLPV